MASSSPFRHLRRLFTTSTTPTRTPNPTATPSKISIAKANFQLRTEIDPDKALAIYSSISEHYSSPVRDRYVQDLVVRRLAKAQRFSDIESLLESHKTSPKITQESYLSNIIRSYGSAGMFDHAINTFHQMDQMGTPRSPISFNALLSACNQSKLFDQVPILFVSIPSKYGVSPDKVSYSILVKSFCEARKPEKAAEVLREMEEKGVEVTIIAYTTVLDAWYKKGMSDKAERLWSEMRKKGCELDVPAFNVRIRNVAGKDPEKAKELIDEMGNLGLKPDIISYNHLMTCYWKGGMMKEAMNVYKGLERNGCSPNASTLRTLVFYLCKNGEIEKAYKFFKLSVRKNKIIDFNKLKNLVEKLVEKKKIKEAKELIWIMKKRFDPDRLKAWTKLEQTLGLASDNKAPDQEATG